MAKSDLSEEQMAAEHESETGVEIETGGYIVIGGRACGESGRIQSRGINTLLIHYRYITHNYYAYARVRMRTDNGRQRRRKNDFLLNSEMAYTRLTHSMTTAYGYNAKNDFLLNFIWGD